MSPIDELLWQQLQLNQTWRSKRFWSHRYCWHSLRHPGGEEKHVRSKQSERRVTQSQPLIDNNTVIPMLHIWMRLSSITPIGQHRILCRIQLKKRSVMQNLCQFVALLWNSFCGIVFQRRPAETGAAKRTGMTDITKCQKLLQSVVHYINMTSNTLESALINAGSNPGCANTSEAMDIIDLSDLSEQLNSVLIEYLVNNDEFMSSQSLSQLDQLYQ